MNFKVEFNIKAIIRWEVTSGRSFQTVDMSNEADVLDLIYCCVQPAIQRDIFDGIIGNKKLMREAVESVQSFFITTPKNIPTESGEDLNPESNPIFLKDVIPALISGGVVSDRYAMHDMQLWELPLFIESLDKKRREDMESSRLWTWYSILPHIDSKKIQHPSDLITFPWEEKEKKEQAKRRLEELQNDFNRFMSGDLIDFQKMGWNTTKN